MCKRPLFSFEEIPPERAKIRGYEKPASDACGYPDSPTRLLRAAPPSPLGTQIFNLWLRVLRTLLTATGSPLDAALCAEISKSRDEVKRCVECGAVFTPKSNRPNTARIARRGCAGRKRLNGSGKNTGSFPGNELRQR